MILCLDSGNSRIKWGAHDGRRWLAQGAVDHGDVAQLRELAARWPDCERLLLANVAGAAAAARIRAALGPLAGRLQEVRSSAAAGGVVNGYRFPEKLGVDRWCALIGARSLCHSPTLVVMAGTATTVDTLAADGRFLGGLILPGVQLMRESLARGTAGLAIAAGEYHAYPQCTEDAIHAGVIEAQAGAIERAWARLAGGERCCLLAGGNAGLLAPALAIPCRLVDNLPLEGLKEIAQPA